MKPRIRALDLPPRQRIPARVELDAARAGPQEVLESNARQHVSRRRRQFHGWLERLRSRKVVVGTAEDRGLDGDGRSEPDAMAALELHQLLGPETGTPLRREEDG